MRMAWWIFIAFLLVQMILVQYMVESYLAGHYGQLPYYTAALGLVFLLAWLSFIVFRKMEDATE